MTGVIIGNENNEAGNETRNELNGYKTAPLQLNKDLNIDKLTKLLQEQNQLLRTLIVSNSKSNTV